MNGNNTGLFSGWFLKMKKLNNMRFKIFNIKGCKTCKQVLIGIARNEDGKDFIELSAWHEQADDWYYQYEVIDIDDEVLLDRVLHDFSELSANEFANSMVF